MAGGLEGVDKGMYVRRGLRRRRTVVVNDLVWPDVSSPPPT